MVGGQYRIERPLGQGGMGVIYRARDPRLDRDVAVKLGRAVSPQGFIAMEHVDGGTARTWLASGKRCALADDGPGAGLPARLELAVGPRHPGVQSMRADLAAMAGAR